MTKSIFEIETFSGTMPHEGRAWTGFLVRETPIDGGDMVWHGTDSVPTPFATEELAQARLEQLQQAQES
jgi:hypothetical protein